MAVARLCPRSHLVDRLALAPRLDAQAVKRRPVSAVICETRGVPRPCPRIKPRGHRRLRFRGSGGILALVNISVTQLTDQLIASYARVGGINHLDGKNLPSKQAITEITIDLMRLVFPGYFDEHLIHSSELKVETATLLDSIWGRLEDEIWKSLEYAPPTEVPRGGIRSLAHQITGELLARLPHIRELLQTDVEAAYNGDPAALSTEEVIVAYPFVETIAVQRIAHELYLKEVPLIPAS